MANAFQSIASGTAILKNYYRGPIIDSLNEDLPIYRAAEKIKEGWSGYQVVRPLRSSRNQGIGATTDGGVLPKIGRQGTASATIAAKFNYLRFGVTGPMISASKADIGSFVRDASWELDMGYKDLSSDISRQLSWNGNGTLATVNTASVASTSLVIAGRESTEPALKFVDVNQTFDQYTSAGVLVQSGITVNSISTGTALSATATLVLDTPITASATDVLVRSGAGTTNEIQGLLYALDGLTTTVYGVNRSTNLSYQGNVVSLAGAQLNLDAMQNPFNEGLRRGNVGSYSAAFCDYNSLRYYQKLLMPDKRFNDKLEGDGSFGSKGKFFMDFNGIPMVPDKDCPTRIFLLPAEVLKLYILCEMEFADETGSMMIAQTDTDAFEVRIRHFLNLFNEQPAACSVLTTYISP